MDGSSAPGGRTRSLLSEARAAQIRRTASIRGFLSFVVILVLLRGLAQGMSSTLRVDRSSPFVELGLQVLFVGVLLALLWWVWNAAGGPEVRRLESHLGLEAATAQTLDRLEGTVALHNRRVGRYGQHVEHLLIGAHGYSSTVLVQPRHELAHLLEQLGPEPDERRILHVARACPPW